MIGRIVDDLPDVVLAAALLVFSGTLAGLAVAASRRFNERHFLVVAGGFGTVAVTAALAIVSEFYTVFEEQFAVGPAPLLLLVVAVILLYLATVRGRPSPGRPRNG